MLERLEGLHMRTCIIVRRLPSVVTAKQTLFDLCDRVMILPVLGGL